MTKFVLWRIIAAFAALSWGMFESCIADSPTVCNNLGSCFVGRYMEGYQTDLFEAFMGIPYAKPPVGARRFKNPEPYEPQKADEILNATMPAADCIQKNYVLPDNRVISGSEDCLYLNVYRPKMQGNIRSLLPVVVFIHGGGWFSGSSNPGIVGPEYFMDTERVIIVTMNYRLGPFGFLSNGDASMPGNFGLKDQNMALKWVQKNIIFFNGDPSKVSLMGQSYGAAAVHLHMLSPLSKGLFHSAIAHSGTANSPFILRKQPAEHIKKLARLCNIPNYIKLNNSALADAFRKLPAEELILCAEGLKYWDVDCLVNFRAVVEKSTDPKAFLVEDPNVLLRDGKFMDIPFMMSTVPGEGGVRSIAISENSTLRTSFNKNFTELLVKLLQFPTSSGPAEMKRISNLVVKNYFGGIAEVNSKTALGFMDTLTDRHMHHPMQKVIECYGKRQQKIANPVVLYFNFSGPYSYTKFFTNNPDPADYGVVHTDDMIYLFRSPFYFPEFHKRSVDASMVQFFTTLMLDFSFGQDSRKLNVPRIDFRKTNPKEPRPGARYVTVTSAKGNGFQLNFKNSFSPERFKFWNTLNLS